MRRVRYGQHAPAAATPVVDHCHEHGWVRETLCPRCNTLMALIDRKLTPLAGDAGQATLLGLLMHHDLCPDCQPLGIDELGETRSLCNWNREAFSSNTRALVSVDLADTFRALAEAETEGNVSQMIRKLLTEALQHRDARKGGQR